MNLTSKEEEKDYSNTLDSILIFIKCNLMKYKIY